MKDSIRTTPEINAIVAEVVASGFVVGDDHNGGRNTMSCSAVGLFKRYADNGELVTSEVVPMVEGTYFSINPLYMDSDGNVRLSVWSCGGTVNSMGIPLEEAVAAFNNLNWFVGRHTLEILARKGQKEVA